MNRLLAVLLAGVVGAGCGDDARPPARATLGGFQVEVRTRVDIADAAGAPLLPGARNAIETRHADATYEMKFGAFKIEEPVADPWRALAIEDAVVDGAVVRLTLAGGGSGEITAAGDGALLMTLHAPAGQNRMAFAYTCGSGEHFQGLGGQAFDADHAGEVVPLWVQEEGIGKVTTDDYEAGVWISQGRRHSTHTPIPIVVSSRGYALAWETDARSVVSLCAAERPGVVRVEVWEPTLKLRVFAGPTPKQAIERVTAWTGRPALPPAFTWAPWLDAMFGSANVRRVAAKLRAEGVPSSVIWTEDWRGGNDEGNAYVLEEDWEVDRELYPDLEAVAADLHTQGFKFLTYNNTFLSKSAPVQAEAIAGGYAIKDAAGAPYLYTGVKFEDSTMLDLSSAAARTWAKAKMMEGITQGADGWMADFGEWLPADARLASGEDAALAHNRYPVEWARFNHELMASVGDGVERVYFMRSAYLGSQPLVQVIWAGDQQTDFTPGDGMRSVIPKGIGLGVTGFPFFGHDIGGYSTVGTPTTTKELWFRWVTFGALSPVMRTHHGRMAKHNWNWESDAASIAHLKRWATLHIRLYPYLRAMAGEAVAKGWPMFRSLAVEWPGWDRGWKINDAYVLGDRVVVAPVLDEGATGRMVELPGGTFYPLLGGAAVTVPASGGRVMVSAAIEEIPAFVPAGALLVLLPEGVGTLVDENVAGLTGLKDVGDDRELWLWPGGSASAPSRLDEGDGRTYVWDGSAVAAGAGGGAGAGAVTTAMWNGVAVTAVDGAFDVVGVGELVVGGGRLTVAGGAAGRKLRVRLR